VTRPVQPDPSSFQDQQPSNQRGSDTIARQLDLPDLPDLDSGTAFEHDLLATAFRLLLADGQPVRAPRLAEALTSDPDRVERTLARLDSQGRIRQDQTGAVTGSGGATAGRPR
jgi:hypothetical protein